MSNQDNSADSNQLAPRDLSRVNTKTRVQRRENADEEWRRNPVEAFENHRKEDLTSNDLNGKLRAIREFESYLLEDVASDSDLNIIDVRDAVRSDVEDFKNDRLKPEEITNSTILSKLAELSHFYNVLNKHNAIAGNPAKIPLEEFREAHDLDVDRPYIPFSRMKEFVNWLQHPFSRAFWLCGLKHGTRTSEVINIDLRCLHLDHPVFWTLVDDHDVRLDPRIRDIPDTILIYEGFTEGTEIPNENTPGPETEGEIRERTGNKRKEKGGSILPVDSELKTALIEWLLVREPTYDHVVNPLFGLSGSNEIQRPKPVSIGVKLWREDVYRDSIRNFAAEERIEECPVCSGDVVEENLASGKETGRRFECRNCRETHWRSIYWDNGLKTSQKVTYHQARHYFTNAHDPSKTGLHDGAIPDDIRKKRIRGDSNQDGDTEDTVYKDKSYEQYNTDIREPYLNGIYKFDIYDEVIPAVGEGWDD